MTITVFRKKVTPKNGNKPFNKYVTTLTKKDGTSVYADVMFEESVTVPTVFPTVLDVDKKNANLSTKRGSYTDEKTAEVKEIERHTLWIKAINKVSEYIDKSLDDFE